MGFTFNVNPVTDVYPPLDTITDKINEQITKVDYTTSVNILKGFDMEVKGETYHFSFAQSDQTNFLMMMTKAQAQVTTQISNALTQATTAMAASAPETAAATTSSSTETVPDTEVTEGDEHVHDTTTTDESVFCTWQGHKDGTAHTLSFTLMEFINFAMEIGNKKQDLLSAGWAKKDKLRAATTETELLKIVEQEHIDSDYRAAQDAALAAGISTVAVMN